MPAESPIDILSDFLDFDDYDIGQPFFSDERYTSISFSESNFHRITKNNFRGKICFIDGGNMELVSAPNFSIHLIRINYTIFKNNQKQKTSLPKLEFLSVSKIRPQAHEFITKFVPLNEKCKKYLLDEVTFKRIDSADISGQQARRLMEWKYLLDLIDAELEDGDYIVMDGTLQTSVQDEKQITDKVFSKCLEKGVTLTGLAKTTTLCTTTGYPLVTAVNSIAPEGIWFYNPLAENKHPDHRAEMYIVKLHSASDYSFRFEVNRDQKLDPSFLGALASNSNDPTFIGYPYGLIDVDKHAKIYKHEKNSYLSLLHPKLSNLKKFIISTNAHDILNVI